MTITEQLAKILRSRKFWALIAALAATGAAYASGNLDVWQAVQAVIAALAVYSTGVALEDRAKPTGTAAP